MSNYPKFNDELPINVSREVTILKREGQVDGKFGPQWKYTLTMNGKDYPYWANENDEASLSSFKEGETLLVWKRPSKTYVGKYYREWTPLTGAEARAAATPQVRSNTAQTKADADYKQRQDEQEEKSIAISLQGFMQAFVSGSLASPNITHEGLLDAAVIFAVKAREACLKKAHELHTGVSAPKHNPTTAAEALEVFGN